MSEKLRSTQKEKNNTAELMIAKLRNNNKLLSQQLKLEQATQALLKNAMKQQHDCALENEKEKNTRIEKECKDKEISPFSKPSTKNE